MARDIPAGRMAEAPRAGVTAVHTARPAVVAAMAADIPADPTEARMEVRTAAVAAIQHLRAATAAPVVTTAVQVAVTTLAPEEVSMAARAAVTAGVLMVAEDIAEQVDSHRYNAAWTQAAFSFAPTFVYQESREGRTVWSAGTESVGVIMTR